MTTTRTFSANYLGKCKACKVAAKVSGSVSVVRSPGSYGRIAVRVTVTFPHGQSYRSDTSERVFFPCLCGKHVEFRRIVGRVSEHQCGAKCLASTSGICECSCGGKNHGASHAA